MAASKTILAALKRLSLVNPGRPLSSEAAQLYHDHLLDLPDWLLEQSIDRLLESSLFFPKIAEIRQTAAQIAGTTRFDQLPLEQIDRLAAEAQRLEDLFFQTGQLDPAAWQRLSEAFASADRPHRAEYTLEKLRRLQIVAASRSRQVEQATTPSPSPRPHTDTASQPR
jgi:ribonuclease BN (tRNA processing enzyme)